MKSSKHLTPKQKLDKELGIDSSSSIDEFLAKLSVEDDSASKSIQAIDDTIKDTVEDVDKSIANFSTSDTNSVLTIKNIETNLNGINDLIDISKDIIRQIYTNISSSDLIDPEIIASAATFIEACHSNIKEWIDLYRDRIKFIDKVKFEMLQQQHKKELIQFKHDLEMKRIKESSIEAKETENHNGILYSTEDIIDELNNNAINPEVLDERESFIEE